MDGHNVAGETDGVRTNDLCDSSKLHVKITFGYFQAAAFLGYYSAYSGNSSLTFGVTYQSLEDGNNSLFRNVGKEFPVYAA